MDKALKQDRNAENYQEVKQDIKKCFSDGISCCLLTNPGLKISDPINSFRGTAKGEIYMFKIIKNV